MQLKPIQYRWKRNVRIFGTLALAALVVTILLMIRDRANRPVAVEPPIEGATLIGELAKRESKDLSPSYNTGNFTLLNDSSDKWTIVVLALWNYGDVPDTFALKPGETWTIDNIIVQNWHGHLILWQMPPDPTPTPMPTSQLGDPCTLSFVTCPETPTP